MSYMAVFSGSANPKLAQTVADNLHIPLGKADINRFSDGEIAVEIKENVRGKDVFILQPTCAPTNDHLMEVILLADALRRSKCWSYHSRDSLFWLCSPRSSPSFSSCAHLCQGGR